MIFIVLGLRVFLIHFPNNAQLQDSCLYSKDLIEFERKNLKDSNSLLVNSTIIKSKPIEYKKQVQILDINLIDSAQLTQLQGIWPVLASRIIKYRNKLGGYFSLDQLKEVYGLKSDIISKISKFLKVSEQGIVKLSINTATFKQINSHPYITFEQTKIIVNSRKFHKFSSIEDLRVLNVFTEAEIKKIELYLQYN